MSQHRREVSYETARIEEMLLVLERLAGGETGLRLPLSRHRDHLDALSHGVNGIAQELVYAKEAAEEASQAKTRFLAMISHEIRTPLSALLGLAEHLRDPSLSARDKDAAIERLRANGRILLSLVDNVLDLSKIEAGRLEVSREWVSPRQVAEEVVTALGHQCRAKELPLLVHCEPGVPELVEADPVRLRQVLTNVVANAIKFTAKGEVRITLACTAGERGPTLAVTVSDTGIGIAAEKHGELFRPFEQAHSRSASNYGGTGLGLVIGRRFAQLMGGDLRLGRSVPGEGSVFVLTLPLPERRAPERVAGRGESRRAAADRLAGLRLLLAEDSDDLQIVYRRFLEMEGARVEVAANGEAALDAYREGSFDVLLLDVNMPRINGIEATRQLRARGCREPILALTAHALGLHEEECRKAGYSACLSKPFPPDTLTDTILALL